MEENALKRKRALFQFAVATWYFSAGADRSLIIPTVNEYLVDYLGAPQAYMGVVISIFAIGSILCAPAAGRLTDWLGTSRPFLLFGICCHLVGAVLYFMALTLSAVTSIPPEIWVTIARFVAGIGYGLDGAIMGTLTRAADPANRSSVIARTILLRQVGVILGPLTIFGLRKIQIDLPNGEVNKYNSPGFFLMFLWSFVMIVVFFCYHDKELREAAPTEDEKKNQTRLTNGDKLDETFKFKLKEIKEIKVETLPQLFAREQIIVCLCGSFSGMFLQSSLETVFTPLSKRLLGFTSVENSVTYVAIGAVAVAGYLSMSIVSKRPTFQDRKALLAGMTIELANTFILLVVIPIATFRSLYLYPMMGIVIFLQCFFMAALVVSSASMLSKFTPLSLQGSIQGARIGVETLATILAPLWIAPTINMSMFTTFSVPTAILLTGFCLTLLSYKVLEPKMIQKFDKLDENQNQSRHESTKLISSAE